MKKFLSIGTLLIALFSFVLLGCPEADDNDSSTTKPGGDTSLVNTPVLLRAEVFAANKKELVLTFNKAVSGDKTGWKINDTAISVDPTGSGTATWKFTFTTDVASDSYSTKISYNGTTTKDSDNNSLLGVNDWPVLFIPTNGSSDTTLPVLNNAFITQEASKYYLVLIFSERVTCSTQALGIITNGIVIDYEYYTTNPPDGFGSEMWKIALTGAPTGAVTIAYIRLSSGDIRDYSGNYLAAFTRNVINPANDTTDPYLISAVVLDSAPNKLILAFSEPVIVKESGSGGGSGDVGWVLDVDGEDGLAEENKTTFTGEMPEGYGTNKWIVTLTKEFTEDTKAWIGYHHGDALTVDLAGNDIHEFGGRPIANRVGLSPDTTAPTLINVAVTSKGGGSGDESWMIMVFSEPVIMIGGDDDSGGWSINGNTFDGSSPDNFKIDSDVWLIKLENDITADSAVTISFNASALTARAYDLSGNKLVGFSNRTAVNNFNDTTAPTILNITAKVGSKQMVITFSEPVIWSEPQDDSDPTMGFAFTGLTWADQPTGNGTAVWTIPLTTVVTSSTTATLAYTTGSGSLIIYDFNANTMESFTAKNVTIQP